MADGTRTRAALLQEVTLEVTKAADARAAATAVARIGRALVDARSSVVWLDDSDGALDLVASEGVPDEFVGLWRQIDPADEKVPAILFATRSRSYAPPPTRRPYGSRPKGSTAAPSSSVTRRGSSTSCGTSSRTR